MAKAISEIDRSITFWFDGRYGHGTTAKGTKNAPTLEELEAIARRSVRRHTVPIDDLRLFGTRAHVRIPVNASE